MGPKTKIIEKDHSIPFTPDLPIVDPKQGKYVPQTPTKNPTRPSDMSSIQTRYIKPPDMTPFHKGCDSFWRVQKRVRGSLGLRKGKGKGKWDAATIRKSSVGRVNDKAFGSNSNTRAVPVAIVCCVEAQAC